MFSIIDASHHKIGHYGINSTDEEISKRYCNVPRELVIFYIENCEGCIKKKKKSSRVGLVIKPIISDSFNFRG